MSNKSQQDISGSSFDFELHYGLSSRSVRDVLVEILRDMVTFGHIHNWDRKLITSPHETLAGVVREFLNANDLSLNTSLSYSSVEEVVTIEGRNYLRPAVQDANEMDNYLFFNKKPLESRDRVHASSSTSADDATLLHRAQGRIVYVTDEKVGYLERATLLMLFSFCIRLQNEDYGYIRAFLERHLNLRYAFKMPYHWQQTSPPEMVNDRQKFYKRVVLSFHITYLTLDSDDGILREKEIFDRVSLFTIPAGSGAQRSNAASLCKASSSVLLTLVIPEESKSSQEEVELLHNPEALWTVLVVNSPRQHGLEDTIAEHYTPIAQFIRGITSLLCTQRFNARSVYDACMDKFQDSDDGSLCDDEHFTKSTMFHSIVKICSELEASITSGLKFIRSIQDSDLLHLCNNAHGQERLGIDHWGGKLKEEVFALEDLRGQIHTLGLQAQESRHALNGITAVLESRAAIEQGHRLKILAYLATFYLPLTATSSLYSMGIFPKSASFGSFFAVLAVFLVITVLGLNWPTLFDKSLALSRILWSLRPRRSWTSEWHSMFEQDLMSKLLKPIWEYFEFYYSVLDREYPFSVWDLLGFEVLESSRWVVLLQVGFASILFIVRIFPALILRHLIVPEINLPAKQWHMYTYRHNVLRNFEMRPILIIPNTIRIVLIPVWIVMGIIFVCILMLEDFILGLARILLCCFL